MNFFLDIAKMWFINSINTLCNLSKNFSSYVFDLHINLKKLKLFEAYLRDNELLINSFNR